MARCSWCGSKECCGGDMELEIARLKIRVKQLSDGLGYLIDVACRCDGWEFFPSKAIEDAQKVLCGTNDGESENAQ